MKVIFIEAKAARANDSLGVINGNKRLEVMDGMGTETDTFVNAMITNPIFHCKMCECPNVEFVAEKRRAVQGDDMDSVELGSHDSH
jgi:hypothetical protein